jgi:hypothetical protein
MTVALGKSVIARRDVSKADRTLDSPR